MPDIGDRNSFVVGGKGSITIGTDKYVLKTALALTDDTVIYEDSTPLGILRHPGQPNVHGDVEVYVSEGGTGIVHAYAKQDANGRTPEYSITYKYTAIDGGVDTLSGTATVSNPQIIDTNPELKVLMRFRLNFRDAVAFA